MESPQLQFFDRGRCARVARWILDFFLEPLSDSPPLRFASVLEALVRIPLHFPREVDTDAALGHGFGVPVVFNDGVARRVGVVDVSSRSLHLEIWYFLQSIGFFGMILSMGAMLG